MRSWNSNVKEPPVYSSGPPKRASGSACRDLAGAHRREKRAICYVADRPTRHVDLLSAEPAPKMAARSKPKSPTSLVEPAHDDEDSGRMLMDFMVLLRDLGSPSALRAAGSPCR